jgi:NTP pyrophosphatase (non-canonical NTP hydrolase)
VSNPKLIPDTPDGRLEHLIEECAEVIQAVQKLKRFGSEVHEFEGVAYDNVENLRNELMDLEDAVARVRLSNLALRPSC